MIKNEISQYSPSPLFGWSLKSFLSLCLSLYLSFSPFPSLFSFSLFMQLI